MSLLSFVLGLYVSSGLFSLAVYAVKTWQSERKIRHELSHASEALKEVNRFQQRIDKLEKLTGEHDTKLNGQTLSKAWGPQ